MYSSNPFLPRSTFSTRFVCSVARAARDPWVPNPSSSAAVSSSPYALAISNATFGMVYMERPLVDARSCRTIGRSRGRKESACSCRRHSATTACTPSLREGQSGQICITKRRSILSVRREEKRLIYIHTLGDKAPWNLDVSFKLAGGVVTAPGLTT
jgi:hypothetical protein